MRRCYRCRRNLPLTDYHGGSRRCRPCGEGQRAKYHANLARSRRRAYRYNLSQYGLTLEAYEDLLRAQGGHCALCEATFSGINKDGSTRRLHVDHDHITGAVRGLLCHRCNALVGWLEKSEEDLVARAWGYLDSGRIQSGLPVPTHNDAGSGL